MTTYIVLLGEKSGQVLKTGLVAQSEYSGNPSDYFPSGYEVKEAGEVEISGDVHLIPDVLIGE